MMRIAQALLVWTFAVAAGSEATAPMHNYPCVTLDNGVLKATVQMPDAAKGYYRSTRFDWSGQVTQVEYKGHTYFGELKGPHKPTVHDHAGGLCEEFGMDVTPGYDEAKEGDAFVKIGVGTLIRGTEPEYKFHIGYTIAKVAPWKVEQDGVRIVFTQDLAGPRDWGYRYVKTVSLTRDQPILTIAHTLTNTGKKPIETDHYGHNMFIFDRQPIGRAYRVTFGFPPATVNPDPKRALLQGRELHFVDDVLKGSFWAPFTGYASAEQNACTVIHEPSGLSLKVTTDCVPVKFCVYAEETALCPEPFVALKIAPGERVTWTTTYAFGMGGRNE